MKGGDLLGVLHFDDMVQLLILVIGRKKYLGTTCSFYLTTHSDALLLAENMFSP